MDRRNVEDIYPLSPLQQGILFHAVHSDGAAYQEQFPLLLEGELDADALERAFRGVVARHAALRTGLVWEGVPQPLQFVLRNAEPVFDRVDWSGAHDWRRRLDDLLAADRRRGHDLARPPLARVTLARIGEGRHVLLLSIHHAVVDGWSLPLVVGDLGALYAAERAGHPAALPPAPRYRDYVHWLLRRDAAAAEAFWRRTLHGFAHATPLPLDRGAQAASDDRALETADADPALIGRAQAFARAGGVTLNTLVQAAWALLLARHAGEADVVSGATVSGRPAEIPGVERTVGLFINTVPVRVRVDDGDAVGDWLRAIQHAQAETREFEYARLVDVQGWSGVPRDQPLFDSLVVFENFPMQPGGAHDDGAIRTRALPSPERTTYALTLVCAPAAGGVFQFRLSYDPARFTADAARRILAGTAAALESIVSGAATVGDLSVLTARDLADEAAWARGPRLAAPAVPVHARVAAQAARTPDAVAVEALDGVLTYAGLRARASSIAAALRARGVGRGDVAAVFLPRSAQLPAALLGVLEAGAAYLPIDPADPVERMRWMLEDAGAAVVLTVDALAGALAETGAVVLAMDKMDSSVPAASPVEVDGDDLAYLIYTSGSTGRPKGVAVPHRALGNHTAWMQEAFPLAPGDRVLQKTPLSFDASVWEFWAPLVAGATLVMGGPEVHRDPAVLARETAERGITILQLVPTLLRAVIERTELAAATRLRRLFAGGEALPAELARAAAAALPSAEIVNLYGPTEACIDATAHRVGGGETGVVPLGAPVANLTARVLDGRMHPVPPGAPGELWLAGEGLGRGYRRAPALTAERWRPDPFAAAPGARMYRTGDRVRRLPDGTLEYLGRLDQQVKLRGVRLEPGEVEAALAALPGVREAAVDVRGTGAAARLVAWVVADDAFDAEAARPALRRRLADAMVPSALVRVDALPRTAGGKLDRRALPDDAPPAPAAAWVAPRTGTERELAEVWREVLKAERVGVDDTFFALGGHSLLAMQMASRIQARMGVELPLRALLDHPRLADMAACIDRARDEELLALLGEAEELTDDEARALAAAGEEGR